jgi:hypothetical protein
MFNGKHFFLKFILITLLGCNGVVAEENDIEPVHYAYSNYLGSGIYRTTGQDVTLLNLPFSFEIDKNEKTTYSLRAPVSFGFFDFEIEDIPELDFPDGVGTVTFTPGIQFDYQYTEQLVLQSYIDIGYARNFTTDRDVLIHSMGISSLYSFDVGQYDSIWVSRVYYAAYNGHNYDSEDAYAAIKVGVDTGLPYKFQLLGYKFQPRVFASAFWYFSEVDFQLPIGTRLLKDEERKVSLSNSFEFGVTLKFDETIGYSWAGIETLGISYRFSENINAVRFLFSFPI